MQEKVLETIKSGQVSMRPRWYFVLRAALLLTGIFILSLALLFILSFILFALRQAGAWFMPSLGPRGWYAFARSLPWTLISLSLIFLFILEVLVRRYAFAYRKPLIYSLCGLVIAAIAGSYVVLSTQFHPGLLRAARGPAPRMPFVGDLYRGYGAGHCGDIHRGIVVESGDGSFIIRDFGGRTSTIILTSSTKLSPPRNFKGGDTVVIFGSGAPYGVIRAAGMFNAPEP